MFRCRFACDTVSVRHWRFANELGGRGVVRFDAHTRLTQRGPAEDLRRDVRHRKRREVDELPDRCSEVVFSCVRRYLVEVVGVGVGADDLHARNAIDPMAQATEVAIDCALCRGPP